MILLVKYWTITTKRLFNQMLLLHESDIIHQVHKRGEEK